jgi:hypothetical protein
MVLKDILAISGEPGLYKFIAQGKNSMIVEHLETKIRSSAFGSAKISSLEEISVYTEKEDVPLGKIFDMISEKENGGATIDYKSDPEKLKAWFSGVVPEYDRDRVYTSDIKKIVHWYNILHSLNLLIKEEPEKAEKGEKGEKAAEVKDEKKAKKQPSEKKKEKEAPAPPKKKPSAPKSK